MAGGGAIDQPADGLWCLLSGEKSCRADWKWPVEAAGQPAFCMEIRRAGICRAAVGDTGDADGLQHDRPAGRGAQRARGERSRGAGEAARLPEKSGFLRYDRVAVSLHLAESLRGDSQERSGQPGGSEKPHKPSAAYRRRYTDLGCERLCGETEIPIKEKAMSKAKDILKKILPPPVRSFMREMEALRQLTERQTRLLEHGQQALQAAVKRLSEEQQKQTGQMEKLAVVQQSLLRQVDSGNSHMQETLEALQQVAKEQKNLSAIAEDISRQSTDAARYASEAVWAEIFNNTITGSSWLTNTAFSPGRWAIGYPVLYVIYRILNEARPKRILELGLGQSTRMIAQYAAAYEDVTHQVVEHDPEWISFFQNDFQLPSNSKIVQLDREMVSYQEAEAVRVFKNFEETFTGQKFDFIFIDAPLGGDMKQYARIDVLGLLPECLSENFVVMIDDANRIGEKRTIAEMRKRLDEAGILYKCGRYSGQKDTIVIAAQSREFLTTM